MKMSQKSIIKAFVVKWQLVLWRESGIREDNKTVLNQPHNHFDKIFYHARFQHKEIDDVIQPMQIYSVKWSRFIHFLSFIFLQQFFDTFWPHDRDRPRKINKGPCQRYTPSP